MTKTRNEVKYMLYRYAGTFNYRPCVCSQKASGSASALSADESRFGVGSGANTLLIPVRLTGALVLSAVGEG